MAVLRSSLGTISALLFSVLLTFSVFAKDAAPTKAHLEAAKELLRLSQSDQMVDQMLSLVLPQQIKAIKQLRPDIPQKTLDRFGELFTVAIRKNMNVFLDAAALSYAGHLSETDIKAISAFYKTEAGRNLIKKQPVMVGELTRLGMSMGQEIAGKAVRDAIDKLKQEGHDL